MSAETLVNQLWSELRIKRSVEQAQGYLDGFFLTYPKVQVYIENTKRFVAQYGFAYTFTGRRRRFPILSFNRKQANRVGRQAVNARIQTTSNDLIQTNMIDLDRTLLAPNNGHMLLSVHDSIVFQLPEGMSGVKEVCDEVIVNTTARKFPWLPVAWKYDLGKGPSYGQAHDAVD